MISGGVTGAAHDAAATAARLIVERLIIDGYHAVDHGLLGSTPSLTTDDFEMILPGGTVIAGERYRQFVEQRAKAEHTSRHCVTNLRVVEHDDHAITVDYILTAHRLEPGETAPHVNVADVVDRWVRLDDEWRHRSRSISPAFPIRRPDAS